MPEPENSPAALPDVGDFSTPPARLDCTALFQRMVSERASDLFLKVGIPPAMRVAGRVRYLELPPLTQDDAENLFKRVATDRCRRLFDQHGEADAAYDLEGVGRFRVNVFRQRGYTGFVFRHVRGDIPSMDELHLPSKTLKRFATLQRGMILVTGIAGSGKSTTIASMINYMNETLPRHIITIEDPIEYIFTDRKCLVDQREVGLDTAEFSSALKHCVRQSPDVIMIGEMRDRETMEAAMNAAETGHLVVSTLHTINAMQTVERIMNMFPPHQHEFLRQQLSLLLEGVVSQRLIPTKDGTSRVPAIEILAATPTIRELVHEGKFRDIYKALREGAYFGTQTFNQSLKGLYAAELITLEEALAAADNPDELKLEIRGIMKGTKPGDFDFKLK
ncbi:MAG: type IV pilus twitching motility protein PilT [Planctomycetes bacterium]|nr:type IV pilus twitching motility protein PilT [Planctomycetota bacterium]